MRVGGGNESSGLPRFAAEVIRIEKLDRGDPFRSFSKNMMRPQFCAYKGGKSITDDLNKSCGRNLPLRLVDRTGVLGHLMAVAR
jgi:crotonobetainyl-CoA:carnitine CoA-transferase CaiB-like acyl-CoA transferase